ncbi:MAG: MFS transporter [Candidatus Hodarchaeota archaeon]
MTENGLKVYGFRWFVLILFMLVNIILQILWIGFATVTTAAELFYGVEELAIYLLSLVFMVVYIPVTFIASWILDKYDFKIGTVIGTLIIGLFGFLRIFTAGNYGLVLIFQIGVAIGQPFILNSVTKFSANWFAPSERTTATGIALMSIFLGTALGLFITPFIVGGVNLIEIMNNFPNFQTMLYVYGISALSIGVIYTILIKNKPPTPPSDEISEEKVLMLEGLKKLFSNFNFWILIIAFLVGLGIFNTILTFIEGIVIPKGHYSTFAGIFGLLILLGGIIGSLIMSILSDKYKKRKILLNISILTATVSLLGISITSDYIMLGLLGFIFGFGLVSASPVSLEYAVDLTKPVPEASSNGILMMVGQIGGILFILGLEDLKMPITEDYFPALIVQTILLGIVFLLLLLIKEEK